MRNTKSFYCISGFAIEYNSIFFSLVFEVYFDEFSNKLILKIFIGIFLKCISNNDMIVFITHDNF